MKSLIESSIAIKGTGKGPAVKTLFNITNDSEKSSSKYYDLAEVSDYTVNVEYSYTENAIEKDGFITIDVPKGLSTLQVKQHILTIINAAL